MRVTCKSQGIRSVSAVLASAVLLFTVAVSEAGAAVDTAAIKGQVDAALALPSGQMADAIAAIFSGVPADEAGEVAAAVLAAVPSDASMGAKKAVGRALTTVANTLSADGQVMFAKAVVTAMQTHATETGDSVAVSVYTATNAAASPPAPTGPTGDGLNTQEPASGSR